MRAENLAHLRLQQAWMADSGDGIAATDDHALGPPLLCAPSASPQCILDSLRTLLTRRPSGAPPTGLVRRAEPGREAGREGPREGTREGTRELPYDGSRDSSADSSLASLVASVAS